MPLFLHLLRHALMQYSRAITCSCFRHRPNVEGLIAPALYLRSIQCQCVCARVCAWMCMRVRVHSELEIPIKYVQLDAWWYKTHACEQGYACACIQDFAPDTTAFNWTGQAPSGPGPYFNTTLSALAQELDVQWDLYQNYFCPERDGVKNRWQEKGYEFIVDGYGQTHPGTGFAHVVHTPPSSLPLSL